jgi:hypothetical protein
VFPDVDAQARSTPEDHVWLLNHLGSAHGRYASTVSRLIATQPALRLSGDQPNDGVVADLVAVCAYLDGGRQMLADALGAGGIQSLLPYVRCLVSGLRRLPSYRGLGYCGGSVGAVSPGAVLVEPDVRQAVSTSTCALTGPVEFAIWSITARKLDTLDPGAPVQRIAFAPGSRFRVLDAGDPAAPTRRVLLRQISAGVSREGLDEDDVTIRDRVADLVTARDAVSEQDRIVPPEMDALTWSPGPVVW